MKKTLMVLILLSTLLAGCSNYTKEEEAKEADFVSGVALIEELLRVGDEMKLEKVTMSDRYNLMYEDYNGELQWLSLNEHHGIEYVVKKSKEPYSYIVREENKVKKLPVYGYVSTDSAYTLYLKDEDLQGASYKETCGKGCTKEIQVDVLD